MLVPLEWAKDYTNINTSTKELAKKMTMTGSKVEEIIELGQDIQKVLVGKIETIKAHPDADKLVICIVDIGTEKIQIVTGAPNVKEGQLIPVAVHGAKLPGGISIKRGKLRGVESHGMLCSGEELGLTEADYEGAQVDGILVLNEEYPLGMDIKEALQLAGEVIDFEITANRPDCLSIIGLAREMAITLGTSFKMPQVKLDKGYGNIKDQLKVRVDNKELCPRYTARLVEDVKIEPSPLWMRRRLSAAGIRPINNIVDITNYVMLELGQPMHAFDYEKIEGGTIVVRNAKPGETIVSLDDKDRALTEDMLVIADLNKPIAIAGVMGGANSEITENTKTIVFESAVFDGGSVRLTSKALGLRSESSSRFEKGLDINMTDLALDRAVQLVQELGAGKLVEGHIDELARPIERKSFCVKTSRINDLLGLDLPVSQIVDILTRVGLDIEDLGQEIKVTVPTYRNDIEGMADLAEEVARIYGYDKIPMTLMETSVAKGTRTQKDRLLERIKNTLTGMGYYEALTYSFTSPNIYKTIGYTDPKDYPKSIKIANPLGEDNSMMRTTIIPSILEVLSRNYNRRLDRCRVFEINPVFIPKEIPLKELPEEILTLAIGAYGKEYSFFTLKGLIEELVERLRLEDRISYIQDKHPSMHPGRCAKLLLDDRAVGFIGELHPKVADNYGISDRVYLGELDLDLLLRETNIEIKYKALPRYPAVTRDLALVIKKEITAGQVLDKIKSAGGKLLEEVSLFDIYEGKQVADGYKSLAYSLTYRASDRTLKDQEVNQVHSKIVAALESDLGARLR